VQGVLPAEIVAPVAGVEVPRAPVSLRGDPAVAPQRVDEERAQRRLDLGVPLGFRQPGGHDHATQVALAHRPHAPPGVVQRGPQPWTQAPAEGTGLGDQVLDRHQLPLQGIGDGVHHVCAASRVQADVHDGPGSTRHRQPGHHLGQQRAAALVHDHEAV